jgi:predicted aspartyl protease
MTEGRQATLRVPLFALLSLLAGGSTLAAQTVVPLDPVGGWLTLSVTLGPTDTLRFILDTGAARSALSQSAAERLGLEATRSYTVQGASGPATVSATTLADLGFAGIRVRSLEALILEDRVLTPDSADGPHPPFDGVLGFDVLRGFDEVLISAPTGQLVLFPPGTRSDSVHPQFQPPIPFSNTLELFVTHIVNAGGDTATAILDSGARHIVLNDAAARLPGVTPDERSRRRITQGVGTAEVDMLEARLESLDIGDVTFPGLRVRISNLPVFSVFGLADSPAMLLGAPVLRGCPVLISYLDRTIRYCLEIEESTGEGFFHRGERGER